MTDAWWFTCYLLAAVGISIGLAFGLIRARPGWTSRRLILIGAAPLPVLLLAPSVWLYVHIAMLPRSECSVETCAMWITVPTFGILAALALFVVNMAATALLLRRNR